MLGRSLLLFTCILCGCSHPRGERYSADSIINYLSQKTSDSISQVVGLTHKNLFTTKWDRSGQIREPAEKYAVWGIFGLGYHPGKASVISDYRLSTTDPARFRHRLRTVLFHEIGHNLGLPHCPHPHCIMNDANETINTVDNSGDDYCAECRRRLSR
jgi:archaemetzincin